MNLKKWFVHILLFIVIQVVSVLNLFLGVMVLASADLMKLSLVYVPFREFIEAFWCLNFGLLLSQIFPLALILNKGILPQKVFKVDVHRGTLLMLEVICYLSVVTYFISFATVHYPR